MSLSELVAPAAVIALLLLVDGSDWIEVFLTLAKATVGAVAEEIAALGPITEEVMEVAQIANTDGASAPETVIAFGFYLVRHALLYFALQRWIFEWDTRWWAVESSPNDEYADVPTPKGGQRGRRE